MNRDRLKPVRKRTLSHQKTDRLKSPLVASGEANFHLGCRIRRFSTASKMTKRNLIVKETVVMAATALLLGRNQSVLTRAVSSKRVRDK